MAQQLGQPEAVTVIAIDLKPPRGGVSPLDSRETFARLLAGTVAQACLVQPAIRPDGELAYTAIVPDTGQTLAVLRRLVSIQTDFRYQHPDTAARFVVHHGLVFAAQTTGSKSYLGSAVRSAHSQLQRLPPQVDSAATAEFALITETWKSCPLQFQPLADAQSGLSLLTFALAAGDKTETAPATADSALVDAALRLFLIERLAAYLGPFAEVLVDAAQRSARSRDNLIEEVSREINDLPTRECFKAEAMAFLDSRASRM
jgi:hypothetical protein